MRAAEFTPTVVPTLRYRDVAAAIDWLCEAFGFEQRAVVHGEDGTVRYAELMFGRGMIMVAPADGSDLDAFMKHPSDMGGVETQICYLFVADASAHCARAKRAGADIILDIEDEDGKGRGYSCRDPEGHVWNFGTYDPWHRRPATAAARGRCRAFVRTLALSVAALAGIFAASALLDTTALVIHLKRSELNAASTASRLDDEKADTVERAVAVQAEPDLAQARQEIARARTALEAAHRDAEEARERLALAERARGAALEQLVTERSAREAAELAVLQVHQQRIKEQMEASERAAKKALEEETAPENRTRTRPRIVVRKTYFAYPF